MKETDLEVELMHADIERKVAAAVDAWKWNRDAEVKDFPPEVQKYLLKDWEPGNL